MRRSCARCAIQKSAASSPASASRSSPTRRSSSPRSCRKRGDAGYPSSARSTSSWIDVAFLRLANHFEERLRRVAALALGPLLGVHPFPEIVVALLGVAIPLRVVRHRELEPKAVRVMEVNAFQHALVIARA